MGRGDIPQLRGSQGTEESLQRIFQQQRQEHQDQHHRDRSLYEHFFRTHAAQRQNRIESTNAGIRNFRNRGRGGRRLIEQPG